MMGSPRRNSLVPWHPSTIADEDECGPMICVRPVVRFCPQQSSLFCLLPNIRFPAVIVAAELFCCCTYESLDVVYSLLVGDDGFGCQA